MNSLRFKTCNKEYRTDRDISSVWEDVRNLTCYYDSEFSSIHKRDEATWYFTFFLRDGKYSLITSTLIKGKVYSKDDNLTIIEIEANTTFSTIFLIVMYILCLTLAFLLREKYQILILQAIILLFGLLINAIERNRRMELSINKFAEKLKLQENVE